MDFLNRRDFLQGTAGVAASLAGMSLLEEAAEAAPQQGGNANNGSTSPSSASSGRGLEHVRSSGRPA